jgi:hypothetical protein
MVLGVLPDRTLRGGDIPGLHNLLKAQNRAKLDLNVPVGAMRFAGGGNFEIAGLDPVIDETGVTDPSGLYRPAGPVDTQLSGLLDIPKSYVTKLREGGSKFRNLLDHNLNELSEDVGKPYRIYPDILTPDGYRERWDSKKALLRLLVGTDPDYPGTNGVVRAVLSNKYKAYDNLDALTAVLEGMAAAGIGPEGIDRVELSDNRLYVFVQAPGVEVAAREMTANYRSPWGEGFIRRQGNREIGSGEEMPLVRAGFVVTNSEVGSGALNIKPMAIFLACYNGWQVDFLAKVKKVHMGARNLDEGVVNWSSETLKIANDLVKSQTKDAVETYLSKEFLQQAVDELTKSATVEITKPEQTIKTVTRELVYTKAEQEGIFAMFIKGGQLTSGGVGQAVTAYAQTVENPDRAFDLNATAVRAMKVAATNA